MSRSLMIISAAILESTAAPAHHFWSILSIITNNCNKTRTGGMNHTEIANCQHTISVFLLATLILAVIDTL